MEGRAICGLSVPATAALQAVVIVVSVQALAIQETETHDNQLMQGNESHLMSAEVAKGTNAHAKMAVWTCPPGTGNYPDGNISSYSSVCFFLTFHLLLALFTLPTFLLLL